MLSCAEHSIFFVSAVYKGFTWYDSFFFQISGPLLPIPLSSHSMVRLGKGQAILGGWSNSVDYQATIYLMTCSKRNCILSLLDRELSAPKDRFVAIPIPDIISGCITGGKKYFQTKVQKYLYKQTFVSPLKNRLPVPNTDWGRFLPRLQQQSPLFF